MLCILSCRTLTTVLLYLSLPVLLSALHVQCGLVTHYIYPATDFKKWSDQLLSYTIKYFSLAK